MPKGDNARLGSKGFQRSTSGQEPPTSADNALLASVLLEQDLQPVGLLAGGRPLSGMLAFGEPTVAPKVLVQSEEVAKGSGAPARAIQTRGGMRLYVADPSLEEWVAANPEEAVREGKAFPSVTSVMKDTVPKPALGFWMTNQAAALGAERMGQVRTFLESEHPEDAQEVLDAWLATDMSDYKKRSFIEKEMAVAYKGNRDAAADRGTNVHALVEDKIRGGNPVVPAEVAGYVRGYDQFRKDFPEIEIVATEVTLLNEKEGYAGTADVIAKIGEDHYVLDWKTNKTGAVYDSVGKQLGALAGSPEILHSDGSRSPAPKMVGGIGVGLGPNGNYSVVPFNTDEHYKGFLGLVKVFRADTAQKSAGLKKATNVADIVARVR